MSKARYIRIGKYYMVTCRCIHRRFFLKPSKKTNRHILFCLGYFANKFHIKIHAFCFMSNHYHIIITDPYGNVSDFAREFHSISARGLNATRRRKGIFWEPDSYLPEWLPTVDDVLNYIAYTELNVVRAYLVPKRHQWPGVHSSALNGKKRLTIQRPKYFFDPDGVSPEEVTLEIVPPEEYADMDETEYWKMISEMVDEKEAELRKKATQFGKTFLGKRAILRQRIDDQPKSYEPLRRVRPRVASCHPEVLKECLCILKQFDAEYPIARDAYFAGNHDVVFPAGTYWMRKHLGVNVEDTC